MSTDTTSLWALPDPDDATDATDATATLPDEIEFALDIVPDATADRRRGATLIVARCHAAGMSQEETVAVMARRRPATEWAHRHGGTMLPSLVAKLWAETDPLRALRTDTGNAQRLAAAHGSNFAWNDDTGRWLTWTDQYWQPGSAVGPQRYAKALANAMADEANLYAGVPDMTAEETKTAKSRVQWALASGNLGHIRAMIELARDEPGIRTESAAWDRDPELFTCGNGTLELTRDGARLREHRRGDRQTRWTPVAYRPGAPSPQWDTYLKEALPDPEVRRYQQKLSGYAMLGANPERLVVFLCGPTGSGKTTLLECTAAAMGQHAKTFNLSLFRAKRDESPRPDLLDATTRRMIFTTEASDRWSLHADEVKRLCGGDSVSARAMRSDAYIAARPAFTPFVGTNAAPTIVGADQALRRRIVAVPFPTEREREGEDKTLGARIREQELEGVLSWLVAGWEMFVREGLDDMPAGVVAETSKMFMDMSVISRWVDECCDIDADHVTPVAALWQSYAAWQDDARLDRDERLSSVKFGRELSNQGFHAVNTGPKDQRVRARAGLALTAEGIRHQRVGTRRTDPEYGGGISI